MGGKTDGTYTGNLGKYQAAENEKILEIARFIHEACRRQVEKVSAS